MINRITILSIGIVCVLNSYSQISDDFSDGDFTNDPTWEGNSNAFVIETERLRSNNDPDAGGLTSYFLSTSSFIAYDAVWEFYINLDFPTSGANYVDVYLISDNEELTSTEEGYFLRFGDTQDEVVFYKVLEGDEVVLLDLAEGIIDQSTDNGFRVRVTRDHLDDWTLEIDDGDLGLYNTIGTITDGDITACNYFGFLIQQSSANAAIGGHYFDDLSITGTIYPDVDTPLIDTLIVNSTDSLTIIFSEDVEAVTAENVSNYVFDSDIVSIEAHLDAVDSKILYLLITGGTEGTVYQLTVEGVSVLLET